MDALFEQGEASAQDILNAIPSPPSYSAVRAMLSKLEKKGAIKHREDGAKYIYFPAIAHDQASESATRRLLRTFFGGSVANAVNTLLDLEKDSLSKDEIRELEKKIKAVKEKERQRSKEE